MTTSTQPACLIRQSACGRIADDPICPKCGLDDRVRYVSEEAGLLAVSQAEAQYWQNHAKALEEQSKKPALRPKRTQVAQPPTPKTPKPPTKLKASALWPFPIGEKK